MKSFYKPNSVVGLLIKITLSFRNIAPSGSQPANLASRQ